MPLGLYPFYIKYGPIDDLSYNYNDFGEDSEYLCRVEDALTGDGSERGYRAPGGSYAYDANGNMTSDPSKGISISYNYLNLPASASSGQGGIEWYYDATGRKLRKVSGNNSVTYIDGIEKYDNSSTFIMHPEGRSAVIPVGDDPLPWHMEFTIRDHLGNTRVAFADLNEDGQIQLAGTDPSGVPLPEEYTELLQENHYYPFGLNMEGQWYPPQKAAWENKYQYNSKEFNDDLGLNWNDYGARWYDAAVGRWGAVDRLAEIYQSHSSYGYVFNNPFAFIDPTGMAPDTAYSRSGNSDKNGQGSGADIKVLFAYQQLNQDNNLNCCPQSNTHDPSGIPKNSLIRYTPVIGSGIDAYDSFAEGEWGWGIFYTVLALSDVVLIKSVVTGIGKAAWRGGLVNGSKRYFGIGMSHNYGATVSRLKRLGIDMSGNKHHWLISQELMEASPWLKPIGNQAWNFTKFNSHASHIRWAHGSAYPSLRLGSIPGWRLIYPFSSTPAWLKLGIAPRSIDLGIKLTTD